jgi:hypothetical protein
LGPHGVQRLVYEQTNPSDTTYSGPFTLQTVANPSGAFPDPEHPTNPANVNGPLPTNYYGDFMGVFKTDLPTRVEVLADVYAPTDLTNGPYPIVFFLHGMHDTIYNPSNGDVGLPDSVYDPATNTTIQPEPTNSVTLPPGFDPIPNYIGYDYIGQVLASHGYIVVSISANGINDQDNNQGTTTVGMQARAELVQQHIRIWDQINQSGGGALAPEFNAFQGEVNLQDIGLMGHSRGGEGVVDAYNYNLTFNNFNVIKAVMPLAPVDFDANVTTSPFNSGVIRDVPLGIILPYSDGDVSDLEGLAFFDRTFDKTSNPAGNSAPQEFFLVMGANHDFFNTVWTPFDPKDTTPNVYDPNNPSQHPFNPGDPNHNDPFPGQIQDGRFAGGQSSNDWDVGGTTRQSDYFAGYSLPLTKRLSSDQERAVGVDYISGFFRRYLGLETTFQPMLDGDAAPPPSAQNADIHVTYRAKPDSRLDINRLDVQSSTNALGGAVVTSGSNVTTNFLSSSTSLIVTDPAHHEPDSVNNNGYPILPRYQITWTQSTAFYENDLPNTDLSSFQALEFRAGVVPDTVPNFVAPNAPMLNPLGQAQDFSVVLQDGEGNKASVKVSQWSTALYYPPGGFNTTTDGQGHTIIGSAISDPLPKLILNMVRIPLNAFLSAAPVFDLTNVISVTFAFNQTATGDIVVSDLGVDDPGGPARLITDPIDSSKTVLYVSGSSSDDRILLKGDGTAGDVVVTVNGTSQGTYTPTGHIFIYGGSGSDTLKLDFGGGQFIPAGGITFDGGTGSNTLSLQNGAGLFQNETETPSSPTSGGVQFDIFPLIKYVDVGTLDDTAPISGTATYKGTAAAETIDIVDGGTVNTSKATQVDSGASGTFAAVLFANKPTVTVDGVDGADTFMVNEPTRPDGLNTLNVDTGPTGSVVNVLATPPQVATNLVGGAGTNTVNGPNQNETWDITGANQGDIAGLIASFTAFANLGGGTGQDDFVFKAGGSITGTINGNGGGDFLDYTAKKTPVTVNLTTGAASFTGGVLSIQNVIGSANGGDSLTGSNQGSILVGHNKANKITAGIGPSLLIGGFGKNTIRGRTGNDIVIGGRTIYDANIVALTAILTRWQAQNGSHASFLSAVASLRAGTTPLVLSSTVFVPAVPAGPHWGRGGGSQQSTLFGGGGLNWFFAFLPSIIVDLNFGVDVVN